MRYMAIDLGSVRIGLAVSDAGGRIASPHKQLASTGTQAGDADAAVAEAKELHADAIVVGLPINMDDTHGPMAVKSETFAALLRERCELPVYLFDERLTSHVADGVMNLIGWTSRGKRRKRHRDMLAAQAILHTFLAQHSPSSDESS